MVVGPIERKTMIVGRQRTTRRSDGDIDGEELEPGIRQAPCELVRRQSTATSLKLLSSL